MEPIPTVLGQETGHTLDSSPVCYRANTETLTTGCAHIHIYSQFIVSSYPNPMQSQEEAGVPGAHG